MYAKSFGRAAKAFLLLVVAISNKKDSHITARKILYNNRRYMIDTMGVSCKKELSQVLQGKGDVQSILDGISSGFKEQLVAGLTGTARSLFMATIDQRFTKRQLIVTHQLIHAQQLYEDMIELSDNPDIYLYPVNELIAAEMAVASPELRSERINALTKWLQSETGI